MQGRKPPLTSALTSEVTTAGKRERRKVQASLQPQQSPDVEPLDNTTSRTCSEAWKPKTYPHEESDSDAVYLSSGRSTPEAPSHVGIKRRKHHSTQIKKQKRSSVESRTMSVTRLPMSVCENSSAEEMDTSRDSSMSDAPPVANHSLSSIKEEGGPHNMKRPRTLRVSLSIPDDVEPGTPFDKVVKAHQKTCSPQLNVETKELPSWENFANSNMIKASSPKQRPRTLPNDLLNSKPRSTSVSSSAKEEAGSSSHPPSAFLASPLPISSSAKVHPPVNLSVPVTNVKTNGSVTSPTVGGKVCTPVISSPATAVGYSASSLLRESGADGGATAAKPVSVVVKESEVTQHQTPNQPTQRNPLLQPKPQSSKPGHSQQTISSGATPGIAQASTTLPLSLATKPTVVATATAADSLSGNKLNSYNLQRGTPTQAPPLPPPKAQKPHPVLVSQSPVTSAVVKQVIVSKPHISAQQASMSSSTPLTQSVAAHSQVSSQLPTQRVLMAPSRPSSVPTQQHVSVAPPPPPRPSSVPTQQQVLVTQSHPLKSAPPQRVLVATSQPLPSSFSAPVQQLVTVTQKPYYVSKGAPSATVSGHHTSTSQTAPSLSSAAPSGVIYSSPDLLQTQHVAQEPHQQQAMPPKAAVPTKSAGDADVIITGVETSGIRRGSVGSDRTVGTGSTGERTVVVSSLVPEAGIASGAGPGRKVIAPRHD